MTQNPFPRFSCFSCQGNYKTWNFFLSSLLVFAKCFMNKFEMFYDCESFAWNNLPTLGLFRNTKLRRDLSWLKFSFFFFWQRIKLLHREVEILMWNEKSEKKKISGKYLLKADEKLHKTNPNYCFSSFYKECWIGT